MIPRADERPKTIVLKASPNSFHEEGRVKTGQTIYPGMLVEVDSTSVDMPRTPEILKPHSTSGGACGVKVAKDWLMEGEIFRSPYTEGDVCPYIHAKPGDVLFVRVADEFSANPGTLLKSAGNGLFVAHGGTGTALMEVAEVSDLTPEPEEGEVQDLFVRAVVL